MDVLDKILKLRLERNWTEYQLAEKSGLPQSTISSWYRKKQIPTIPSLEKICDAFNTTLSQFFREENLEAIQLTTKQLELVHEWNKLDEQKQNIILDLLRVM